MSDNKEFDLNDLNDVQKNLIVEEYRFLRNEILKRIEFRSKNINFILAGAAGFIGLGLKQNSVPVLLIYPILSFFLALSWIHNGIILTRIGSYIRQCLETEKETEQQNKKETKQSIDFGLQYFKESINSNYELESKLQKGYFGWENYLKSNNKNATAFSYLNNLSVSGLVLSTQLLSIILALVVSQKTFLQISSLELQNQILIYFDVAIFIVSFIAFIKYSRRERL